VELWEYKIWKLATRFEKHDDLSRIIYEPDLSVQLNHIGQDGWELVEHYPETTNAFGATPESSWLALCKRKVFRPTFSCAGSGSSFQMTATNWVPPVAN